MKADTEIRIIAQLLEAKTELQEKALTGGRGSLIRKEARLEIKGIDKGIEIVKKIFAEEEKDRKELLKNLKKQSPKSSDGWIPIKRVLPKQDGMYLVTFDDGFVTATEYCDDEWQLWADSGEVLAWQEVPKAYKEG